MNFEESNDSKPEYVQCSASQFYVKCGDMRSLPIYSMPFVLMSNLPPLGTATAKPYWKDPDYSPLQFEVSEESLQRVNLESEFALKVMIDWHKHFGDYETYIQFEIDVDTKRRQSLYRHTELLCNICDIKLGLDPTPIWEEFNWLHSVAFLQEEYFGRSDREAVWTVYAKRLDALHRTRSQHSHACQILKKRIQSNIKLRAGSWHSLPQMALQRKTRNESGPLRLFYSYSHMDESLRDELEKQLTMLKRQAVIAEWHDRKISAGIEWKGQIDEHLESSDIILLLLSPDFLASDYCYDVEATRALERHESGSVRVISVILRACEWKETPFAKLQLLPTDGKHVKSWRDRDEAFLDVAKGIRIAANELRGSRNA